MQSPTKTLQKIISSDIETNFVVGDIWKDEAIWGLEEREEVKNLGEISKFFSENSQKNQLKKRSSEPKLPQAKGASEVTHGETLASYWLKFPCVTLANVLAEITFGWSHQGNFGKDTSQSCLWNFERYVVLLCILT